MTTYVEISKSDHGHGGHGWEFGTCLWSPTRNRSGADRYSLMRELRKGDRIIHIYRTDYQGSVDTYVLGESMVTRPVVERIDEPSTPDDWAGVASYYRIDLHNYKAFPKPVTIRTLLAEYADEIRDDLLQNNPKFYPFTTHGSDIRTVQGIYLARSTGTLEAILGRALNLEMSQLADGNHDTHAIFAEAKRLQRELYYFARNPQLARTARKRDDYRCTVCGFRFADQYIGIGDDFIEVHHINPLSERPEGEWSEKLCTSIDDVTSLCSNCHRMIHRRRPAYTISELRSILRRLSD